MEVDPSYADLLAADAGVCTLSSLAADVEEPGAFEEQAGALLDQVARDVGLARRRKLDIAATVRAAKSAAVARLTSLVCEARASAPDYNAAVITRDDTRAARRSASRCLVAAAHVLETCAEELRKSAATIGALTAGSGEPCQARASLVELLQAEAARVEGLTPQPAFAEARAWLAAADGKAALPPREEDPVPDAAAAAGDAGTGQATADDDGEAAEQLGNRDAPAEEVGAGAEGGAPTSPAPRTTAERLQELVDGIAARYSAFALKLFALREAPLLGESSDETAARSRAIGHAIHAAKKAAVAGLQQLLQEHADAAQGAASPQELSAREARALYASVQVINDLVAAYRAVAATWGCSGEQPGACDAHRALFDALETEAQHLGSLVPAELRAAAQEASEPPEEHPALILRRAVDALITAACADDAAAGQAAAAALLAVWRQRLAGLAPDGRDNTDPQAAAADAEAWAEFAAPLSLDAAWRLVRSCWWDSGAGALEVARDSEGLYDALGLVALVAPARGAPAVPGAPVCVPAAALAMGVGLNRPYADGAATDAAQRRAAADAKQRLAFKAAPAVMEALMWRSDVSAVGGAMGPRLGGLTGIAEALEGFGGRVPFWCIPNAGLRFLAAFSGAFAPALGKAPPDEAVRALAEQLRAQAFALTGEPRLNDRERGWVLTLLDIGSQALGRAEARIACGAEIERARQAQDNLYKIGCALRAATRFIAAHLPETRRAPGWRCDGDARTAAPTEARPTSYLEQATEVIVIGWGDPLPDARAAGEAAEAAAAADALAAAGAQRFPTITHLPEAAVGEEPAAAAHALVAYRRGAASLERESAGEAASSSTSSTTISSSTSISSSISVSSSTTIGSNEDEEGEEEGEGEGEEPQAAATASPATAAGVEAVAEAAALLGGRGLAALLGEQDGAAAAVGVPPGIVYASAPSTFEPRGRTRPRLSRHGGMGIGWALLGLGSAAAALLAASLVRARR